MCIPFSLHFLDHYSLLGFFFRTLEEIVGVSPGSLSWRCSDTASIVILPLFLTLLWVSERMVFFLKLQLPEWWLLAVYLDYLISAMETLIPGLFTGLNVCKAETHQILVLQVKSQSHGKIKKCKVTQDICYMYLGFSKPFKLVSKLLIHILFRFHVRLIRKHIIGIFWPYKNEKFTYKIWSLWRGVRIEIIISAS